MKNIVHGFAGRQINVNQSKLDNGFVVLEIQNAQGGHCASVVLTPKGAKQLSEIMEAEAQKAIALGIVKEMAGA
jgi:hypothetical protein